MDVVTPFHQMQTPERYEALLAVARRVTFEEIRNREGDGAITGGPVSTRRPRLTAGGHLGSSQGGPREGVAG